MARKKKSEMTSVELVDQALNGLTWNEAETAGIEILARCMALHAYARDDGEEYIKALMKRIYVRACGWANETGYPTVLAFGSAVHK